MVITKNRLYPYDVILFPDELNMRRICDAHSRGVYWGSFNPYVTNPSTAQSPTPTWYQPYGREGNPAETGGLSDAQQDIFYVFTLYNPSDYSASTAQNPYHLYSNAPLRWFWLFKLIAKVVLMIGQIVKTIIDAVKAKDNTVTMNHRPRVVFGGNPLYEDPFITESEYTS